MKVKGLISHFEGFVLRSLVLTALIILSGPAYSQHLCTKHRHALYNPTAVSPAYSTLQNNYDVIYYDLLVRADDSSVGIEGDASILFRIVQASDTIVVELKMEMSIDSVFLNGKIIPDYQHENGLIKIASEKTLIEESLNTVRIVYKGGERGGGFFSGLNNRRDFKYDTYVTYTLSEPFQASNWYPVKQNLHDKADSVRVRIVTDPDLMGGSNGLLTSVEELEDGRLMYTWESDYPITYYLISIAIADYIDYSFYLQWPGEKDSMLIQNFIYDHPEILENEKEKIDITADMLILYDSLYGEYPFKEEKYGHAMAPMGGGMEHQTMTTLQSFNFDLVAHELAHQWFGNNVTCGSWQDIWINEGFASYGEYLAREYLVSEAYAIEWMANAHEIALNYKDESIYLTDNEARDVSEIFNYAISYKKGAAILHMLRYEINNDSLFFSSFREFQKVYEDSVATGADYLELLNKITGDDYTWFFDQWYYGKGFPVIQATWRSRGDSTYLSVYQGNNNDDDKVFKMHIDFQLTFSDNRDSLIRFYIDKAEKSFDLRTSGDIIDVQIDPLRKNLMISSIYEYIPEGDLPKVSPNPFRDSVYLDFQNDIKEKSVYISSMNGKVIYERDLGTSRTAELNLSGLPPGIFLMIINEGGKRNAVRIVKL